MPKSQRERFVRLAHEGVTGGHLGRRKTEAQVSHRAYWPGWKSDVASTLRGCTQCAQYHRGVCTTTGKVKAVVNRSTVGESKLGHYGKTSEVKKGERVYPDSRGSLYEVGRGFSDPRSYRVNRCPCTGNNVTLRFGCPKQILTDRGPEFESELIRQLCLLLGVDKIRTTGYKPSTNGTVERFHRTLNSMLAKRICESQRDWDEHVAIVLAAYRASPHESTGYSPNRLLFGRENVMPLDIMMGTPIEDGNRYESYHEYVFDLDDKLQSTLH